MGTRQCAIQGRYMIAGRARRGTFSALADGADELCRSGCATPGRRRRPSCGEGKEGKREAKESQDGARAVFPGEPMSVELDLTE